MPLVGQLLPLLSNASISGQLLVYSADSQTVGNLLYPLVTAEFNAGLNQTTTFINYSYPVGNVLRYGADPSGVRDSTAAFAYAISAQGTTAGIGANVSSVQVQVPNGSYNIASSVATGGQSVYYNCDSYVFINNFSNLNGTTVYPYRMNRNTYGTYDQANGMAVLTNSGNLPAQVMGISVASNLANTSSRDSVAFYTENQSFAATLTTSGSTYTSTTVVSTSGATVNSLKVGMIIDTLHSPKYSGFLTGWSADGKTLTVSGWYQQGNTSAGQVPANGTNAVVNANTKVWSGNSVVFLNSTGQATSMACWEFDTFNNTGTDWTPSYSGNMWGVDSVNLGNNQAEAGFVQRGNTANLKGHYYGFSSRGAASAAFHVGSGSFAPFNAFQNEAAGITNIILSTSGSGGATNFQLTKAGGMDLGPQSSVQTSFIDFHSSGNVNDYDVRVQSDGGSATLGQGRLTLIANNLSFNGLTTSTTSPAAGGAGALPATPKGYITFQLNGTNIQIPYY